MQAASLRRAVESDQIVRMHGSWWQYEALLAIRGDAPVPRIAYSDGEIELRSPYRRHERTKSSLGRLVEAYCFEREVYFDPIASTTLKASQKEKGVEPDESYAFTPDRDMPGSRTPRSGSSRSQTPPPIRTTSSRVSRGRCGRLGRSTGTGRITTCSMWQPPAT